MSGKVFSSALEHFKILRGNPGSVQTISVRLDSTAADGTYYIQIHDKATEPTAGDNTTKMLASPQKIIHVSGADDFLDLDFTDGPVRGALGVVVALSTTEFTYTAAGNFMVVQGDPS